jgi:hypothetical protein
MPRDRRRFTYTVKASAAGWDLVWVDGHPLYVYKTRRQLRNAKKRTK